MESDFMDMDAMTSQVESAWAAKERARQTSAQLKETLRKRAVYMRDQSKRQRLEPETDASTTNPAVLPPATSDNLSPETAEVRRLKAEMAQLQEKVASLELQFKPITAMALEAGDRCFAARAPLSA